MTNITANQLIGKPVYDKDLHKVGKISHLYIDGSSHRPTWATVKTGFFGNKESFVPLSLAEMSEGDEEVIVQADKDVITDAPNVDPDGELTPKEQATLYTHYRQAVEDQDRSHDEADDDTRKNESAQDTDTQNTEQDRQDTRQEVDEQTDGGVMTRHEEELRAEKKTQETGKVRLKKYVVTENATITIPLTREKVRIVREPVSADNWDSANSGPAMTDQTQEVVLHEEVATVQKVTRPKETVRLDKEQEMTDKKVGDEVRKEHVDVEREDTDGRNIYE